MLAKYEQVSYELLRPGQIRALKEKHSVVYVPTGTLEWHSFQNPLGTDGLIAHAVCCEAALKHGGVVLPPFYQGLVGTHNWGPEGWRGFTQAYNTEEMFEAAMRGIVRAMVYGEWRVIVGITGHGSPEQLAAMQRAITDMTQGSDSTGFAEIEGTGHTMDDDLPFLPDHAAAWETSCMMYAYPDKVDMAELSSRMTIDEDCFPLFTDTGEINDVGIGGSNPLKYASPERGRMILERVGDSIGTKARKIVSRQRS